MPNSLHYKFLHIAKYLLLRTGVSRDVVPHCTDRVGGNVCLHHQRALRPRDAVPGQAPARTAQGREVPPGRPSRLRPLRRRESRTSKSSPRTPSTSDRRKPQGVIYANNSSVYVTIKVSTGN